MNSREITDVLARLRAFRLALGSTKIYYIGNCSGCMPDGSPRYDDRSWAIVFETWRVQSNRQHHAPHNLNLGTTKQMEALTEAELGFLVGQQLQIAAKAWRADTGKVHPFEDALPV